MRISAFVLMMGLVALGVQAKEPAVVLTLTGNEAVKEDVRNFPIEAGKAVKFTIVAEYEAQDGKPAYNDLNVVASWVDARAKKRHGGGDVTDADPHASWKYFQRDYVRFSDRQEGRKTIRTFQDVINTPTNVVSVDVETFVKARPCTAKITEVKAEIVPALPKRVARIVLANPRKGNERTIAARLKLVEAAVDEVFRRVEKPDLVMACSEVFPESGNTEVSEQSELVPEGPTSQLLIRYAKAHHCYMAGGLTERTKDGVLYNAVVLFDRDGVYQGSYHKVHLTTGEFLGGMRAGSEFKVFSTDFGKVGFCVCWDNFFPETTRQLQLNGAELLIFPLACTTDDRIEHVFRTRALDTGLPIAFQIRQGKQPNRIYDGYGKTIAEAREVNEPCWADIDLSARARVWWLSVGAAFGDPYQLYNAERRPELYK